MQVLWDSYNVDNNASQDRKSFIENDYMTEHRFDSFYIVATEMVTQILQSALKKSCELDPIQALLQKNLLEALAQCLHP